MMRQRIYIGFPVHIGPGIKSMTMIFIEKSLKKQQQQQNCYVVMMTSTFPFYYNKFLKINF
ncbi:hypothetical protein BLA29_001448 [Euroglyphus maynei]|uniref:Uncharacterized protein n=1 Tax=Euroglyphus maynei TaxID=6958 RepID=A0A1Y3BP48_EURMA|nr:hypothetical protein BLA29_001448 [Euroglyphus maynei]